MVSTTAKSKDKKGYLSPRSVVAVTSPMLGHHAPARAIVLRVLSGLVSSVGILFSTRFE